MMTVPRHHPQYLATFVREEALRSTVCILEGNRSAWLMADPVEPRGPQANKKTCLCIRGSVPVARRPFPPCMFFSDVSFDTAYQGLTNGTHVPCMSGTVLQQRTDFCHRIPSIFSLSSLTHLLILLPHLSSGLHMSLMARMPSVVCSCGVECGHGAHLCSETGLVQRCGERKSTPRTLLRMSTAV